MTDKLERANLIEDIRKLRSKQKMFENNQNEQDAERCRKKADRLDAKLKLLVVEK
jgi:hypothetical protein